MKFLAPLLGCSQRSFGDRCVCVDVCRRYFSYSFCPIHMKLCTHDLCANTLKTVAQIFEILILQSNNV